MTGTQAISTLSDKFFDQLETRAAEAREQALLNMLPGLIQRATEVAPSWAAHLKGHTPAAVTSRAELAKLPVMRKSMLKDLQAVHRPLGGLASVQPGAVGRIFSSPGPIYEPEGTAENWWRAARALYASGFRSTDVVHNTFAYHLTPGGWIMDSGARAIGCTVIPAGPGNTEQQLDAIEHLRPTAYTGVPDYLKILLDKAKEAGRDTSSITKAMVSGGALFPSLRAEYKERGITCTQAYATADLGMIAYESPGPDGTIEGMIVEEGLILEIVRPGTGEPLPEGEVGEVVVTSFNRDYPMIRLATGDMSAVLSGISPCGRTNMRIKGWLGRADQTTKVKGMFVHPESIAAVAKRHPELGRLRLVVARAGELDVMTLRAEAGSNDPALAAAVADSVQQLTKLKADIQLVGVGTLPNDGKVISDERTYG
jgi:phenylacetate-CoA ligase